MANKKLSYFKGKFSIAGALTGLSLAIIPQAVLADVQARPCPFNCEDAGIPRAECKDWRAEGKCFVEDQRNSSQRGALHSTNSNDENLDRQIEMVGKVIPAGGQEKLSLKNRAIEKIDVVLRRQGSNTETQLSAGIEGHARVAAPQQIDRNENHVLSWNIGAEKSKKQKLVLNAINGDVYVESVHVFYKR